MAAEAPQTDGRTAVLEVLWGLRSGPSRGPKPSHSVAQVAAAAVEIADAEGVEAVSMERIGRKLGVSRMALYRYVTSKAELVALMVDRAVGPTPDLHAVPGGWREKVIAWAQGIRATWQVHPWLPNTGGWQVRSASGTVTAHVIGPNEVASTELGVALLASAGFTPTEQLNGVFLISGHIRISHSMTNQGVLPWMTDLPGSESLAALRSQRGADYPALNAVEAEVEQTPDEAFLFGLNRILDGLELLLTRR